MDWQDIKKHLADPGLEKPVLDEMTPVAAHDEL